MPYETLFSNISPEEKKRLDGHVEIRKYFKNEIIFSQNSKISGVYAVLNGSVKRFIEGVDGKECIFDICGHNELFGHRNIFTNDENFDSSVAITSCEIAFIPKHIFLDMIKSSEVFNLNYIRLLSEESLRHIRHAQVISQLSLKQRMSYYLLYLLKKNKDEENRIVEISRDDLANLLGTVKESAVRTLQEFKLDGSVMASGRKIYIANIETLKKAAKIGRQPSQIE